MLLTPGYSTQAAIAAPPAADPLPSPALAELVKALARANVEQDIARMRQQQESDPSSPDPSVH